MEIFFYKLLAVCVFLLFLGMIGLANAVSLNLITYNVNLLPKFPFVDLTSNLNNPDHRAANIFSNLKDSDIVACQEVISSYTANILNDGMYQEGFVHQTPDLSPSYFTIAWTLRILSGGVKIYSKWPFASEPTLSYYPRSYGLEDYGNKGIVYVPIEKEGMRFNIIATHSQSVDSQSPKESEQSKCLFEHVDHLAGFVANLNISEHEPVIYMGDFNCNSGSASTASNLDVIDGANKYPNYSYLLKRLKARAVAEYDSVSLPYSFNPVKNEMAAKVKGAQTETLDHILCSKEHKCPIRGTTSIFNIKHENPSGVDELSDHYPVRASLTFETDEEEANNILSPTDGQE